MLNLFYTYLFANILYKEKIESKKSIILSSLIYLILYYLFSLTTINNIFYLYIINIIFFRILLNKTNLNYYLISIISIIGITTNNYYIYIIYLLIVIILKKYILKLINYLNSRKKLLFIIIISIILTVLIYLLMIPTTITNTSNIIIMLLINTIVIINVENSMKLHNLNQKYQELKLYSKNNDKLVTNYRSMNHENKNQLIIIKSMLEEKNNNLEEYIDNIIEEKIKITNKWLNDLKYIPIPGIKNFVNYKLSKLENLDAIIEIYISKELEKIKGSKIDLNQLENFYTIIGILLDNIIDSISEQEEKLVSINAYIKDNKTNIELANTYKTDIDINKLTSFGYTTKGKNHGVGLYLVNQIIKNNKIFELNTRINNKFFVQHLIINHPKNHLK